MKAKASRRAAVPADQAAFQNALQIQNKVEPAPAHFGKEWQNGSPWAAPVKHDNFIDRRGALQQWQTDGFNGPSQMRLGKSLTQKTGYRQRSGHVADGAVQNNQDFLWIELTREGCHGRSRPIGSKR